MRGRCAKWGLSALCAAALLPAAARADGPAAYQADPGHTGLAQGTSFAPPLGKRWVRRDLGPGASFPVIAEGKVFLTAGSAIYALDLHTGATAWSRSLAAIGTAYDDGRVFAVDRNGVMQALSAQTGEALWTSKLPGASSFVSPPTAYGDYVYASGSDVVFGVRQEDGIVVWSQGAATDENVIPAVDADKTYTTGACNETTALERMLGVEVWRYSGDCFGAGGATAVVHGDRVYTRESQPGVVLDSLTGFLLDSFAATASPAFADGAGYFVNEYELFARDEASGVVQWRYTSTERLVVPPLVAGGFVYTVDDEGKLLGFDRAGGQLVWESDLQVGFGSSGESRFPGIAAAGDALVVSANGRVIGYTPGPDTPGIDDIDKPPAGSGSIALTTSREAILFGQQAQLNGELNLSSGGDGRSVVIEADRWPFGAYEPLATTEALDEDFEQVVKPDRNTMYRARYTGTNPAIESAPVTVFSEPRYRFRVIGRGPRRVLVKVTLSGPADAGLRSRRVYVYHYRQRARAATRIGSVRLRGKPTRASAQRRLRTPPLRRSDLFYVCRMERRDDGFGRPDKRLARCGRRRMR
jgi:outer membrane protein assembly factor BamB